PLADVSPAGKCLRWALTAGCSYVVAATLRCASPVRVQSRRAPDDVIFECERRISLRPSDCPITAGLVRSSCHYLCVRHSRNLGDGGDPPRAPIPLLDQWVVVFSHICGSSHSHDVTPGNPRRVSQICVMAIWDSRIIDHGPVRPVPVLDQRMRNRVTAIFVLETDCPNILRCERDHAIEPIILTGIRRLDFGPRSSIPMQRE